MAPELQKAAERIFRAGFRAGRGTGFNEAEDKAWREFERNEPGYRPVGKSPALSAPYGGDTKRSDDSDDSDSYSSFATGFAIADAFSIGTSSSSDSDGGWSGGGFSGGGGGDGGGAGASGDW